MRQFYFTPNGWSLGRSSTSIASIEQVPSGNPLPPYWAWRLGSDPVVASGLCSNLEAAIDCVFNEMKAFTDIGFSKMKEDLLSHVLGQRPADASNDKTPTTAPNAREQALEQATRQYRAYFQTAILDIESRNEREAYRYLVDMGSRALGEAVNSIDREVKP